jgi:hypothetical protein
MAEHQIVPERITKPIQLLAAWLVGLVLVNGSFLFAASNVDHPAWASGLLVIAAVFNVPIFIGALFLLQTKFRPQIQEDSYYAEYLKNERDYADASRPSATDLVEREVTQASERIVKSLGAQAKGREESIADILRQTQHELLVAKHGPTRTLSELYCAPDTWIQVVEQFGKHASFIEQVEALISDGLAEKKYRGYRNVRLTDLGQRVAREAEQKNGSFGLF